MPEVSDARHHQRVISVKEDEIRPKFLGLRERKGKGLLVGWNFRGEEDGGGLCSNPA